MTGVSLNEGVVVLDEGGTRQLKATITPSDATYKAVSWKSSDPSVATVDAEGNVKAVKAGTADITVTTADGGKEATCTVTVSAATVAVTGVTLDKSSASLTVGGTTTLTATVTPSSATYKTVRWESSDTGVATVTAKENGECEIKGMSAGTAVITVTTEDSGKTASCTVNVSESLESAKAEFTALLSKYAVKDQSTPTATGYKLVIPTVSTAEDFNNVAVGKMYIEASNVTALNAAIDEAYRVLNASNDVTAIENAITNFKNKVNGTNGTPGLVGVKSAVTLL